MKNLGTYALSCLIDKSTYECEVCGILCFDKNKILTPTSDDGYGLCYGCGGDKVVKKPKYIKQMELARLQAKHD